MVKTAIRGNAFHVSESSRTDDCLTTATSSNIMQYKTSVQSKVNWQKAALPIMIGDVEGGRSGVIWGSVLGSM